MKDVKTTKEPCEVVYEGRIFEIVHQEVKIGEKSKTFEFARRAPGTRILLLSEDETIVLTREFRRELGSYDLRLPGGKVVDTLKEFRSALDAGKDLTELAIQAAKRELREETGYVAKELELLGVSKCGATIEWDLYFFLCKKWEPPRTEFVPLEDEDISVAWYSLEDARKFCLDGTISEERSAVRILRLLPK